MVSVKKNWWYRLRGRSFEQFSRSLEQPPAYRSVALSLTAIVPWLELVALRLEQSPPDVVLLPIGRVVAGLLAIGLPLVAGWIACCALRLKFHRGDRGRSLLLLLDFGCARPVFSLNPNLTGLALLLLGHF